MTSGSTVVAVAAADAERSNKDETTLGRFNPVRHKESTTWDLDIINMRLGEPHRS